MAKKEKRISINKLESIMSPSAVTVPLDGADGTEIMIRRTLPLSDVLQFVAEVVAACVDAENGTYTPEVIQFAIKANVLTYYANFNLPSNVEKQYELIYNTDAVDQVMAHINKEQYDEIICAVNQKIEYERSMMVSAAVNHLNELTHFMKDFSEKSEALFSSMTGDDMENLMHNLSSIGKVDERELVHAVFDAQKERSDESPQENILAFPHTTDNGEE